MTRGQIKKGLRPIKYRAGLRGASLGDDHLDRVSVGVEPVGDHHGHLIRDEIFVDGGLEGK